MEKALKIAWVDRIQDESQASWKIIPNQFFHKKGGLAFLTKCNFATSTLDHDDIKLPTFYKRVLDYWCEFKISTVEKKLVFFYQTWYDAGITKISDILNQNQDFLKWH